MDLIIKDCKFYIGQIVYLINTGKGLAMYEVCSLTISRNKQISSVLLKDLQPMSTGGYSIKLYEEDFYYIYFTEEDAKLALTNN